MGVSVTSTSVPNYAATGYITLCSFLKNVSVCLLHALLRLAFAAPCHALLCLCCATLCHALLCHALLCMAFAMRCPATLEPATPLLCRTKLRLAALGVASPLQSLAVLCVALALLRYAVALPCPAALRLCHAFALRCSASPLHCRAEPRPAMPLLFTCQFAPGKAAAAAVSPLTLSDEDTIIQPRTEIDFQLLVQHDNLIFHDCADRCCLTFG